MSIDINGEHKKKLLYHIIIITIIIQNQFWAYASGFDPCSLHPCMHFGI